MLSTESSTNDIEFSSSSENGHIERYHASKKNKKNNIEYSKSESSESSIGSYSPSMTNGIWERFAQSQPKRISAATGVSCFDRNLGKDLLTQVNSAKAALHYGKRESIIILDPKVKNKRKKLLNLTPNILSAKFASNGIYEIGAKDLNDVEVLENICDLVIQPDDKDYKFDDAGLADCNQDNKLITKKIKQTLQSYFDKLFIILCCSDTFEKSKSSKELAFGAAIDIATDFAGIPVLGSIKNIARTAKELYGKEAEKKKIGSAVDNINHPPQEEFCVLTDILKLMISDAISEKAKIAIFEKNATNEFANAITKAFVNFASHHSMSNPEEYEIDTCNENIHKILNQATKEKIIFSFLFINYIKKIIKDNKKDSGSSKGHEILIRKVFIKTCGLDENEIVIENIKWKRLENIRSKEENIKAIENAVNEFKIKIKTQHETDDYQDKRIENLESDSKKMRNRLEDIAEEQSAQSSRIEGIRVESAKQSKNIENLEKNMNDIKKSQSLQQENLSALNANFQDIKNGQIVQQGHLSTLSKGMENIATMLSSITSVQNISLTPSNQMHI